MKISEAVQAAAVFLQLDELSAALEKENGTDELSEENAAELDLLVRCCNLVLGELAESEFVLRAQTEVNAENGRIERAALDERLNDILSVTAHGRRLPVREYFDCITVPYSGKCTVTYTFAPAKVGIGDDSPYAGNKPSARLIAYGIAREYCQISGMTDEAAVWDGRFAAAATEEARGKCEKTVLPRKWR